jgi:large subunit ribosomal protein L14
MIQVGTELKVVDNSGAKKAYCIKVLATSSNNKIAKVGSFILVVIKALRKQKSKSKSKVKKGEIVKALVIRTKNFNKNNIYFFENAVVLYSKQMKLIGTRIFGPVLKSFRYTKHLRITLISKKLV